MGDVLLWLEAIAGIKTLYELTRSIPERFTSWDSLVESYRSDPATIQEAENARLTYNTFTDDELQDIIDRIRGCRDRAKLEGDPERRVKCLCTVLIYAKDGNAGDMPDVGGWQDMYDQLKCEWLKSAPAPFAMGR